MNPLTLEWVEKAEGDLATARREYRARKNPNYDAVCFHAQQATEKYLKSVLQENGKPIPRVHSLTEVLVLVSRIDPSFALIQGDALVMEGYSTQFRYPGLSADKSEAKVALQAAERVRKFIRASLNL